MRRRRRRHLRLKLALKKVDRRQLDKKKLAMKKEPPAPPEKPEVKEHPAAKERGGKRYVLLCPGPVMVTQHVRSVLAGPDICHREPEFIEMLQTIRAKLLHALGLDGRYTSVVLSGSGTASLEAAVAASVDPGKKLMVINNGVYGSRIAQIAKLLGIPLVEIRSPLTEGPDLNRVAAALKRESGISAVALVHHETSTGLLNPVEEIGALTKQFRKRFLVDGISSLGAERLNLAKSHVSLCVGSSGKCLHGLPGLSFVLISHEEIPRILKLKPRSLYLDLGTHLKSQEAGDPPFTPAVPLFVAFHAALDDLVREGVRGRSAKYKERSAFLRGGFKKIGLQFLLDEKLMSNTLTAMWLPKGLTYQQLHDPLKKAGFVIYAGQSELKGKIFRIAHMGQLLQGDLKEFLRALKEIVGSAASS